MGIYLHNQFHIYHLVIYFFGFSQCDYVNQSSDAMNRPNSSVAWECAGNSNVKMAQMLQQM